METANGNITQLNEQTIIKEIYDNLDFNRLSEKSILKLISALIINLTQKIKSEKISEFSQKNYVQVIPSKNYNTLPLKRKDELTILTEKHKNFSNIYLNFIKSGFENLHSESSVKNFLKAFKLPYDNEEFKSLTDNLYDEYDKWKNNELPSECSFLFIKKFNVKISDKNSGEIINSYIYLTFGTNFDGERNLYSIDVFDSEDNDNFSDIFEQLSDRGLKQVHLIISDKDTNISEIVTKYFPKAIHQNNCRELYNPISNISDVFFEELNVLNAHCEEIKRTLSTIEKNSGGYFQSKKILELSCYIKNIQIKNKPVYINKNVNKKDMKSLLEMVDKLNDNPYETFEENREEKILNVANWQK